MQEPPTAVLAFKSYAALDAIEYLKAKHPEWLRRVEFIGFGNLPLLEYLEPRPVASVEENFIEIGRQAMQLLLQRLVNKDEATWPAQHIEIPCRLVVH